MEACDFFREFRRMCRNGCKDCPLDIICHGYLVRGLTCEQMVVEEYKQCIPIVDRWSKSHPEKTRAWDFFSKHPNAMHGDLGEPTICCARLGYCDMKECDSHSTCKECWDTLLEDK